MGVIEQRRPEPDPKYLLGRGKLEDVLVRAMQLDANVLIFDPDLSPGQAHAIADFTDLKVIDRTMLILDIFAQRAKSRDGKLQVELAQLRYRLPRLHEKNTMMCRLTGGIGGRGPGETKLEVNRRRARERITRLEREIERFSQQRAGRRAERTRRRLPVVAIVGYTNAGKSTLLNTLTQSEVLAEDHLFATLDPTTRRLRFPREREMIIADTVGFIRDLPRDLAQAFRATLEELDEADLLLARGRRRRSRPRRADGGGRAHPRRPGAGRDAAPAGDEQDRPGPARPARGGVLRAEAGPDAIARIGARPPHDRPAAGRRRAGAVARGPPRTPRRDHVGGVEVLVSGAQLARLCPETARRADFDRLSRARRFGGWAVQTLRAAAFGDYFFGRKHGAAVLDHHVELDLLACRGAQSSGARAWPAGRAAASSVGAGRSVVRATSS